MPKEINLLKEVVTETPSQQKIKRYVTIFSPLVLLVFGVIVAAVYIYSLIQTAKATEVNRKLKETENLIQSLSEVESYQRGTKLKLATVKNIIKEQVDYAEVIKHLQEIAPPEINYTSLSVSGEKFVEVSYKAANSDLLKSLVNSLLDPKIGGRYFDQVKLKNLLYSRDGSYLVSLTFHLKT
ncbi:hypothetical protein HY030_02205 [Candidatus Gottesmanbacteria bacterium]|nr:hypothetical protein [Candidatus Gottesmanbacteria bacterium]